MTYKKYNNKHKFARLNRVIDINILIMKKIDLQLQ